MAIELTMNSKKKNAEILRVKIGPLMNVENRNIYSIRIRVNIFFKGITSSGRVQPQL